MMLEQEIEKYLSGQTLCNCDSVSYRNIKNLILGFAEPREKQIEVLEGLLDDCSNSIKELEKENAELKEQNRNYEQLIDNGSVTLAKERLKTINNSPKQKK